MRWPLALAVLLAGCPRRASGPELVPPAPPAPSIAVAPLRLADAAGPGRGLVLAAGGPGRAAPVELIGRATPVAVAIDGGRTATVEVAPADPGKPAPAPPPGPEWTAALVRAELAATTALALAPGRLTVALRAPADSAPPGSATLAVAVLAGMTGARLDPAVAVLADLAPDGTLVALEDPAAALERAIARGARRIILPLGGQSASARAGKKPVDLVRLAARRGAAAALAPDLPHAYRALTGAPMPDPAPVAAGDMVLAQDEIAALTAAYQRHLQRVATAWPALVEQQTRARLSAPAAALIDAAAAGARRAERLRAGQEVAAGTIRLVRAATAAEAASRIEEILAMVRNGDPAGAGAALAAALAPPALPPITPAGTGPADAQLRAIAAFASTAESAAWSAEAAALGPAAQAAIAAIGRDRPSIEVENRLAEAIAPAILAAARAREHTARAADRLALPVAAGAGFLPDAAAVAELTRRHREAAGAVIAIVDRRPAAAPRSAELTAARRLLAAPVAATSSPAARLGPARLAHDLAERAIARGREVGADIDPWSGAVVRVGHPERLASALAVAETTARQAAAAARTATGRIPVAARVWYQAARALAGGRAADRLFAVELYRSASSECRLAVLLAASATPR